MNPTHTDKTNGHNLVYVEPRDGAALYYDLTVTGFTVLQDSWVQPIETDYFR